MREADGPTEWIFLILLAAVVFFMLYCERILDFSWKKTKAAAGPHYLVRYLYSNQNKVLQNYEKHYESNSYLHSAV